MYSRSVTFFYIVKTKTDSNDQKADHKKISVSAGKGKYDINHLKRCDKPSALVLMPLVLANSFYRSA